MPFIYFFSFFFPQLYKEIYVILWVIFYKHLFGNFFLHKIYVKNVLIFISWVLLHELVSEINLLRETSGSAVKFRIVHYFIFRSLLLFRSKYIFDNQRLITFVQSFNSFNSFGFFFLFFNSFHHKDFLSDFKYNF